MVAGGGTAVVAARGRKPRGTVGVGKLATGAQSPEGSPVLAGEVSEEMYLQ
jgi:hypothetical protein